MYYQNSIEMPERVQKWGCYATVISAAVAGRTKRSISQEDFVNCVIESERRRYLTEDPEAPGTFMYVADPTGIFRLFGLNVRYLGKKDADYICQPNEIEILLWRRWNEKTRKYIYHFTLGNGRGMTVYDPWAPFSKTASEGELRSKRIFLDLGEVAA
ncbi:DUF261 family protein [Sediminispirochaeta smaragdinae]|uniref:Peptidase C39-like domain-containing protein n=2 Tax=Sediminispirochaeta smaragdinae (strain DSM 11293 / JCM 15392 / SEBR 4228) TaxID=573413 RepID=E1R1I2_SEDSS|nr:DUF261 family protein [Sediminispirochaeta smaragdinae]ADK81123.1 hypothetical protein Spirs_2001 [Sediminispirochaeta smaragdinae DSM 11293]